ncbi:MAG: TIGR03000 domain-containing protein [Planctomycetes bacterium]|nr:TIGR03000 domain-containing protein [Planctomycetota bacterium]
MSRKYLLIPAILSLTLLLATADFAQAQRRGGAGRGRGGYISRSYYPRTYSRSYYPRTYSRSYSPYRYGGYGTTWFPGGWYGYGAYRRYGGYGYPGIGYGRYMTYPTTSYYAPTYVQPAPVNIGHVRILVPTRGVQVWVNGNLLLQNGTTRLFRTAPLDPGVSGSYRIRASWMEGTQRVIQERVVNVSAGQTIVVDFTQVPRQ